MSSSRENKSPSLRSKQVTYCAFSVELMSEMNKFLITDDAADNYVRAVEDHTDFTAVRLTDSASTESLSSYDVVVSSHQNFVDLISERRFGESAD